MWKVSLFQSWLIYNNYSEEIRECSNKLMTYNDASCHTVDFMCKVAIQIIASKASFCNLLYTASYVVILFAR